MTADCCSQTLYFITTCVAPIFFKCFIFLIQLLIFLQSDTKTYSQAQELERFFELQLRKLLPKHAKPASQSNRSSQNLQLMMPMSLHDLIEMDDQKDEDYSPNNNPKRKRSTPSV
jgi:hypothetical protein